MTQQEPATTPARTQPCGGRPHVADAVPTDLLAELGLADAPGAVDPLDVVHMAHVASEALAGLGADVPPPDDTPAATDAYRLLSLLAQHALTLRDSIAHEVPAQDRTPVPQMAELLNLVNVEVHGARKSLTEALDAAHTDTARLAAFLAAAVPSVLTAADAEPPDLPVLLVQSIEGQISYHVKAEHLPLFAHVQRALPGHPDAQWDGHTATQSHERLQALTRAWARYGGNPSHLPYCGGD